MIVHVKRNADIEQAIAVVNLKEYFDHNIKFSYEPAFIGKDKQGLLKYRLVLRTCSREESKAGIAYSASGRKTSSACWHAHGMFFAVILNLDGWIEARDKKIKSHADNWQDFNVGNYYNPLQASNACRCSSNDILSSLGTVNHEV
jgi:hypothetical protein